MDEPLDVFGQQPGLNRLYTQLCLCFPLPETGREHAVDTLKTGFNRLTTSVPWLSGDVVYDEDATRYCVRAAGDQVRFTVKDLSDTLPSSHAFRTYGFPARLLDEKLIAPCETIRRHPEQAAPVFLVQVNFIRGGLLLVLCGLHSCMDMAGQGQIISLLAKTCRGEALTDEELHTANLRGDNAIPLLDDEALEQVISKRSQAQLAPPASKAKPNSTDAVWSNITFSGGSLAALKAKAMQDMTADFVSTDDCLTAFLWQSITRARLPRFSDPQVQTAITRTVDARSAAGIPLTYTGNAAVKAICQIPIQELINSSLGTVASHLRDALKDAGSIVRAEATLLSQGKTPPKASVDPSTGVNLSSWSKEKMYELDFGPELGMPEAVRRPAFEAWESLVYLMPKRQDGEVAAAVCLRVDDLERLKRDAKFMEYAHHAD